MLVASRTLGFLRLTTNSIVLDAEELSLMVARHGWVSVHVAWQHGQAGRKVSVFHPERLSS